MPHAMNRSKSLKYAEKLEAWINKIQAHLRSDYFLPSHIECIETNHHYLQIKYKNQEHVRQHLENGIPLHSISAHRLVCVNPFVTLYSIFH